VSYALISNVENLVLMGGAHLNGIGNELANRLTGNTGDNVLDGGAGADIMIGGYGNDTYIVDRTGDRVIEVIRGGIDTVRATISHTLAANVENLVLGGSAHVNGNGNGLANRVTGNAGNNILNGGQAADTLIGNAGNDRLFGGTGNDTLLGGAGVDRVLGGSGNDSLNGGGGADRLEGGVGNDRLLGGAGKDHLSGGMGADQFVFTNRFDSNAAAAGRDVITDFSRPQGDKIHLTAMDANLRISGNQAFEFVGTNEFSGSAGELRYQQSNGMTLILADLNGDRRADFLIELSRQIPLNENDFFL